MTRRRRLMQLAIAAAGVLAAPSVATAGDAPSGVDLWSAAPGSLPPADTGKPAITLPPALWAPDPTACLPALPCGTRLLGEVRKDGAVVLQVPALRW
jgi:hypothetical protein